MKLIRNDYVSMEVQFDNNVEKAFLLGAFSTTLYDFEIMKNGTLQVDVPLDGLEDFYSFLDITFKAFEQYV